MHQDKKVLSIRRTKLFIQQLNKTFYPTAEQNISFNSSTKLIIHLPQQTFSSIG
jgi:hypothetical protein